MSGRVFPAIGSGGMNLWRRLALPRRIRTWSLTSLQQRLVKTGGRLVKHARYYWLLTKVGKLVYIHTKLEDQNGNPG